MDSQCQQNTPAPTHALGGEWVGGNLQGQCTANLGFAATPYSSGSLTGLSLPDTWPMLRSLLYETLSISSVNTRDNQRSKPAARRLGHWRASLRQLRQTDRACGSLPAYPSTDAARRGRGTGVTAPCRPARPGSVRRPHRTCPLARRGE